METAEEQKRGKYEINTRSNVISFLQSEEEKGEMDGGRGMKQRRVVRDSPLESHRFVAI